MLSLYLSGDGYATRLREYYYDARKEGHSRTDEEHYAALEQLAGDIAPYVRYVIADPSAARPDGGEMRSGSRSMGSGGLRLRGRFMLRNEFRMAKKN